MGVVDKTYRKPWRCRLFGHKWHYLVAHTSPTFTVYRGDTCSRCGWNRENRCRFEHNAHAR